VTDAERIAELERQLAERDAVIAAQAATIARLEALVATLTARVADLEAQLRQNSSNSSKPPSSDPPSAPTRSTDKPTGRKPGGQPGHKGTSRARRVPDHVVDHRPPACKDCGGTLTGEDPEPQIHQVTEIPPVRAEVTEHRLHTLRCAGCGTCTTATLPPEVPRGAFGPRLVAFVALLTGVYALGKRAAATLTNDWFGAQMAVGSVTACEQAVSAALATPVKDAHEHVEAQPVVHADETSWREARRTAWLWVAATAMVTVFLIQAKRGQDAARRLLGRFAGILVSDRWNAYNPWSIDRRQLCWAHLLRHWQLFAEWPVATTREIGLALRAETQQMFAWWHKVRDGTMARAEFQTQMAPLRARVEALLRRGVETASPKPAAMCREILKLAPALWTFVDVAGIEPTNNHAERQIRRGVLWRKRSFGTHSAAGSRFAERILTTAATLRQQRRNITAFVIDALEARLRGHAPPSLLPSAQTPT
jgi:transposase